ncbi:DUF6146 family protein [Aureibaculum sp. 2210JD6-5]|uniref:DUF6146 family protein n=1 Tax=Aureibaculum sp. 2210JD6-5 TaxID=3103957 RepID=UPI002AAE5A3A|nr:DUF6146 family protein [Aureibaculum sp. 2210JD6-5]MDY7394478.1 DUF6146 family protein [Aureibaculum sp. 2210JD6-5]
MKNLIYILGIFGFLMVGCGTQQTTTTNEEKEEPVRIANDSLEYEIIIIDPGFNSYLATAKPESYYTQSSLETRNRVMVMEWNNRFRSPLQYNSNIYENEIDYQPNIDYGMEVNYKLYQYFQFAQKKYGMRLSSFRVD